MTENRIKNVHFIGIGGVGMSGIARVAKEQGMKYQAPTCVRAVTRSNCVRLVCAFTLGRRLLIWNPKIPM